MKPSKKSSPLNIGEQVICSNSKRMAFSFSFLLMVIGYSTSFAQKMEHTEGVSSAAFSPDGKKIVSAGRDNVIKIWDAGTQAEISSFGALSKNEWLNNASISPDGKKIVSSSGYSFGDGNGKIVLWDIETGKSTNLVERYGAEFISVVFSPDGKSIAFAVKKTIELWDVGTATQLKIFKGHSDLVKTIAFSPDGKEIVTGGNDETLKIWDIETGKKLKDLKGHSSTSVAFSPDGRTVVSGSYDQSIILWDVETGKQIKSFVGNTANICSIAFSPDGKTLASGNADREIKIWDVVTGKEIKSIMAHARDIYSVAFSPDGKKIVSGSLDCTLKVWNAETGKKILSRKEQMANISLVINNGGHKTFIRKIAVTNDGKNIISAGDDKIIDIWNAQTGELIETLYGQTGEDKEGKIMAMALSPDNKYLAVGGFFSSRFDFSGRAGAIRLYDFESRKLIGLLQSEGKSPVITALAFSEDSKYLVSGGEGVIKLWNVQGQTVLKTFEEDSRFYSLAVSNNKIISGSLNRQVKIWDINGATFTKTDTTHNNSVTCVAVSPDGNTIASGGFDELLVICDRDLNMKQVIDNKTSPSSIAFSPDGKKLFLGCEGDTLKANLYEFNGTEWQQTSSYDQLNVILATAFIDNNTAVCAGGSDKEIVTLKWEKNPKTNGVAPKEILRFSGNGKSVFGIGTDLNQLYFSNKEADNFTKTILTKKFDLFTKEVSTVSSVPADINRAILNLGDLSLVKGIEHLNYWGGKEYTLNKLSVFKNGTEETKILKEEFDGVDHLAYTFLKNNNIVSGGYRGIMLVYNPQGKMISRLIGHSGAITDVSPTADGNFLVSCSDDQIIKFWKVSDMGKEAKEIPSPVDILEPFWQAYYEKLSLVDASKKKDKSGWNEIISTFLKYNLKDEADMFQKALDFLSAGPVYPVASLFIGNDNEWILWSEDGYFTSSKHGGKYIGYHINQGYDKAAKFYPFEQFDLKFNRPDIMLARVGINDEMLSKAYYLAYKKRLTKMGLTEDAISDDIHLPEIVLQSRSLATTSKTIDVEFDAKDDMYLIDRVNILINDVPVYGSKGFSVRNLKQQSVHEKFNVELTKGKNKIQVSALNEKGAESMKETYYVTCNDAAPQVKNRYVVTIGVSNYANNDYDLKYAAKDAGDLAKLLELNKGEFASTKVLRILDTMATRENILKSKQFLMQSKVGDQVILFVAGHGLLDDKLDWYFATTDVDFNSPALRGLAYGELEGLLDSIPSRNKLMLMDACNSGEVDKEDAELVANNSQPVAGVKSRGFKSVTSKSQSLGLQNSFQLMQNLFSDISNGTGTTVISSASGAEFAYESAVWNNGVFTFALLEGLKTGNADKNKDGKIVVSELRDYIGVKVNALTQGKQNPTSRKENLEFDFRVW